MGALEPGHLVIILIIALFIFGPSKVGELGWSARPSSSQSTVAGLASLLLSDRPY